MAKIITLTLTPALDCSATTERLYPDGKLRCDAPHFEPGGGGINVSRAIKKLGGESLAIYSCGGSTGQHLTQLLKDEQIQVLPMTCQEWTRQNLNVVTRSDHQQYRFIMPGAQISTEEQQHILQTVIEQDADYCVISGSLPDGIDADFIPNLIRGCHEHQIKVVFDSSGKALQDAVELGGLFFIKPNAHELAELSGKSQTQAHDLEEQARSLIEQGKAEIILVSLGPQGALLVTQDICEQIIPPKIVQHSTVGAGDSMVGAVVLALSEGLSIRQAVRRGVAAGTAATMNKGTALCKADDVEHIYRWILGRQPI